MGNAPVKSMSCQHCSQTIVIQIPPGDAHPRRICKQCNTILYENPKIVTGVIPLCENKILICKRNIEPRKGFWTIPSGFMELNETLQNAALRESKEEAGINPQIDHLHTVYDLPHIGQVYFLFKGFCDSFNHEVGIETMECKWVDYGDIPWKELAFRSVFFALKRLNEKGPHFGKHDEV